MEESIIIAIITAIGAIIVAIIKKPENKDSGADSNEINIQLSNNQIDTQVYPPYPIYPTYLYDLTGEWIIREVYEYGETNGTITLVQEGTLLSGEMLVFDKSDDDSELQIRLLLSGNVNENGEVFLRTEAIKYIVGDIDFYYFDNWAGVLTEEGTIVGISCDEAGISGEFQMIPVG